ncbi:transposase [Bacillus proteolyticus]|uniref:Transposase n=1 Tax=Bacillus proteolyticus TaxID=2026192 RepID=A0AA44KZL1_9BACI|nr:transposase [Bacillus proteolyticus]
MKSFRTETLILRGIEAMHMMKKGQLHQRAKSAKNEVEVIHKIFGLVV